MKIVASGKNDFGRALEKPEGGTVVTARVMLQKENLVAVEASNRWMDNLFALRPWCRKKFNIKEAQFNKQFEILQDFD